MITVRKLRYRYPGSERDAVDGIDFEIADGEIFGFLGPNGAGKSTTQRVLIRLLRDFDGEVEVAGRDLREWGDELYERIGVQFEIPNHYLKLTGRENLSYFAALYAGDTVGADELLGRVGLQDVADRRVGAYSKGMRGRLGFVRALLNRPALLVLDEPTGGLDPVTNREIRGLIREERERGATVFLTTHDMAVADDLCDRVAFIVDGRIEVVDEPRALRRRYGQPTVRVEFRRDGALEGAEFPLDGIGDETRFLEILRSGTVESIHTQETTLEEVFVQVTGATLR